jgi:hypothetical protein
MTPLAWMKKNKLSCADVAKRLGMRSKSAKMNVWRQVNGHNVIPDGMKFEYVEISDGAVTLSDLCKIKRVRKAVHAQ